jgi:hypothetical protein
MNLPISLLRAFAVPVVLLGFQTEAPIAHADFDDIELNGEYTAHSDGQNARTNDQFHDEQSVSSTWTVESTCQNYLECSGKVTSDLGWVADLIYRDNRWRAVHQVDGWEKCADGSTAPGQQFFSFYRDPLNSSRLVGWDKTVGPSGACGKNQWLAVEMSFTLTPKG